MAIFSFLVETTKICNCRKINHLFLSMQTERAQHIDCRPREINMWKGSVRISRRDKSICCTFTCCTLPPCVTEVFQLLSCCCALFRVGLAACCCCRRRASRCSVKSSILFCSSSHFISKLSMVMHWLRRAAGGCAKIVAGLLAAIIAKHTAASRSSPTVDAYG